MLQTGERVIRTCPVLALDGLRGTVLQDEEGGKAWVRWEHNGVEEVVGVNQLEKEADFPDYPRPQMS